MKKILYIATSDIHLKTFHLPYLKWLKSQGYEVSLAIEKRGNIEFENIDHTYYLQFPRSIKISTYFSTYKQLKSIIDKNGFNLIHCHTPLPSAVTRLAAHDARKKKTKVLYTAHGFHFYKGAPLKNWLLYYPAEYILSAFTDGIITINQEDFGYTKNRMFHRDSFYLKGIGIDSTRFRIFNEEEIASARKKMGYPSESFILLYVAGFIHRKNHQFIIKTLPILKENIPMLRVLFAGKGVLLEQSKQLAKQLGVSDVIDFLDFRNDIPLLAAIADVGISSSRHEGLGLGLAEEMLCSLPVVATIDKGHKELIENGKNGFLYPQGDKSLFIKNIISLYENPYLRKKMGKNGNEKAQNFVIENSLKSMATIYHKYLD